LAMIQGIRKEGPGVLPWTRALRDLQARIVFLGRLGEGFSDLSDSVLLATLESWLQPFLSGVSSLAGLKKINLQGALLAGLSFREKLFLDQNAPSHIVVPSGSRIILDYGSSDKTIYDSPVLAVRLQEMFGCETTPRVAKGRVPVTLHLLSPAGRAVQVTKDLESFWNNTYRDVKKDLMGRYPRHFWPEDPRHAVATRRTRPKNTFQEKTVPRKRGQV